MKSRATGNLVLFELNEVPFRVLDYYISERPNSCLAKLTRHAAQFTTVCDDVVELDPWISWATLHRGVIDREHGIYRLGQLLEQIDKKYPPIWKLLAQSGVQAGVFGSLHSSHLPEDLAGYDFYVPDFFSDESFAKPNYIQGFQRFNLGMTRRSARNVDTGIPLSLAIEFLKSLPQLGVTTKSACKIALHLISERRNKRLRIRRRSLQALLMGDIFVKLLGRKKARFATFYTNHVAAAMHRYWAATFPDDYEVRNESNEWSSMYGGELLNALDSLDLMLSRLMSHMAKIGGKLLITSSMGQSAVEHQVTKGFITITDLDGFMAAMGCPLGSYKERHAMVPLKAVAIAAEHLDQFLQRLSQVSIAGTRFVRSEQEVAPLSYNATEGGFVSLLVYFEQAENGWIATPEEGEEPFQEIGLGFVAHEDGVAVTAHHCKEGSLLIYDPGHASPVKGRPKVSTLEIAPAILSYFGVTPPGYMVEPSEGLRSAMSH